MLLQWSLVWGVVPSVVVDVPVAALDLALGWLGSRVGWALQQAGCCGAWVGWWVLVGRILGPAAACGSGGAWTGFQGVLGADWLVLVALGWAEGA